MRISSSGKLGIAAMVVGVLLYATVALLMVTRSFVPVNLPISLSPGHFSTGTFKVNTEGTYWIAVYTRANSPGCDLQQRLKAKWTATKGGKVQSEGTYRGGWWLGGFYGTHGEYKIDVDVLSDTSCLNSAEPRIEIGSDTAYEEYAGLHAFAIVLALPLVGLSVTLLILSLRAKKPALSVPEERIVSDLRVQYVSHDRYLRFPLGRKFSGMPTFGFVAVTVGLCVLVSNWVMIAIAHIPAEGNYVRITRPKPALLLASLGEEPVIVSVRRSDKRFPNQDEPRLFVNSQSVSWQDLSKTLRAELSRRAGRVVYVEGEDRLPYSDIAQVVDIAGKLGLVFRWC
jgi:biopolymer transport protein ExbD